MNYWRVLSWMISLAVAALMYSAWAGVEGMPAFVSFLAASVMLVLSQSTLGLLGKAEPDSTGPGPEPQFVSVVVPFYNEEPELLKRGLRSLARQSRVPDRVWIIDDGSTSDACTQVAEQWVAGQREAAEPVDARLITLTENGGKRRALVHAFENDADCDVFFTMDSDTILDRQAIEQGMEAFRDPEVFGIAGVLFGHNRRLNWLTRIVEMEFTGSFLINRAAMSRLGSVLVTCGSLAAYRAEICRDHVGELLGETFLGKPVINGDDRKLTQFALQRGRVVLVESCIGRVALPESLSHLFRQRTRWSTSFFRGTLYMLRNMSMNRVPFWLTVAHAGIFCAQTLVLLIVILLGSQLGWLNVLLALLAASIPEIVARHQRYWSFSGSDRQSTGLIEYLSLSPLATLLNLLVLLPARYYAVFHLKSNDWRTRQEVETVTLSSGEGD